MARTQYLGFEDLPKDFKRQAQALSASLSNTTWNRRVIGHAMILNVVTGFLRGEDPKGEKWKSNAKVTQFGGKFAKSYKKRPSDGSPVTASSLRLNDSSELMGSYEVITATPKNVEVGPKGERNRTIAFTAAKKWKNKTVGWGPRGVAIVDFEVNAALKYIMRGLLPPKIPAYTSSAGLLSGRRGL